MTCLWNREIQLYIGCMVSVINKNQFRWCGNLENYLMKLLTANGLNSCSFLTFSFSSTSISRSRFLAWIALSLAFLATFFFLMISCNLSSLPHFFLCIGVKNIINNMDKIGFQFCSSNWSNTEYTIATLGSHSVT